MDNKNPNTGVTPVGGSNLQSLPLEPVVVTPELPLAPGPEALSESPGVNPVAATTPMQASRQFLMKRLMKWGLVLLVAVAVLFGLALLLDKRASNNSATPTSPASDFNPVSIPLESLAIPDIPEGQLVARQVTINGLLQAAGGLVLAPSPQPAVPQRGQLYYDQTTNLLGYFNGLEFVFLGGEQEGLGPNDVLQEIAGLTGQGLAVLGGQIVNTGVLSVQGQVGAVNFVGGSGISVNGTTITNTGVISVVSASPALTVADDGNGNLTLDLDGAAGTGTVASPGGTAGRIAKFTGVQAIEDSLLSESGSTVTLAGNLSVTGLASFGSPLTVANGGTGAASLTANGVLIGNGTGAVSSIAAGAPDLCLVSTGGAPTWANCTNPTNAVQSLNGLTGNLNIANATGLVDTITIDDASTSNKGIAQFNATNFDVVGGSVNTKQNISTTSSPTFNSLTLSGNLTVQGGTSTLGTLTQAGSIELHDGVGQKVTIVADNLSADRVYSLPDAGGDATLCVTSGNCIGDGGSAPNNAAYLVASLDGILTDERALAAGSNISLTDGGANGNLTVATVQNPTFTTSVTTPWLQSAGVLTISSGAGEVVAIDAGTTIELQDSTNVTGTLDVSVALNVGTGDAFAVNSSGAITAAAGITSSGTIFFSALDCTGFANGGALTTNGSGQLMCSDDDGGGGGGGGITGSGTDGTIPVFTGATTLDDSIITQSGTTITVAGDLVLSDELTVSNGGTGATSFTSNGVLYGNGTGALQVTSAGTGGQVLIANGSGVPTFVTFSGDVTVSNSGVTTIQPNSVALGTDTTGDYVANIGSVTGLTVGSNSGEGSTPSLSVIYGSVANTAVQGNVTLTCPSGSGNLTGGGNSITLGNGGTCNGLSTVNDPTFSTSVTTPNLILTGDGDSGSIAVGTLGQGTVYTLPDPGQAAADICLSVGNCTTAGTAGGDLTGTYPNPTIAKLQNTDLDINTPLAGHILIYNETNSAWENSIVSGDIVISETGVATIQSNAVALGSDTTGNYVIGLTAGDGIDVTGTAGEGWSPVVAVLYGSSANTAVEGDTSITVSAGTNLTGGGSITLGAGGTVTLHVTNSPTFSGTLTVQGGTATIGTTSQQGVVVLHDGTGETGTIQTDTLDDSVVYTLPDPGQSSAEICLNTGNCAGVGGGVTTAGGTTNRLAKFTDDQAIGDSLVSDDGSTVTVTGSGNFVVQGGTATLGTLSQAGTLVVSDGSSNTISIVASGLAGDYQFTLPDTDGNATFCMSTGNCIGTGGGGAPSDASYLVLGLHGDLSNERVLTNGSNITITDGGANGNLTVATVQNPTFTTSVTTPELQSSGALTISSGGSDAVVIAAGTTIELQSNTNVTGILDVSVSLNVGTGDAFAVNSSGAITAATGITSSGTITFSGLDCTVFANGGKLTTDDSGVLSCADDDDATDDGITGSGTDGTISMFTDSGTIGDSIITQSGGDTITIAGSLTLNDELTVANGGTGATNFTSNGVLYGNGSGALQVTAAGTSGQVLVANGSGVPTFVSFSGDVIVAANGTTTIQANSVALGTDTTGDYVATLGALTGLSTSGNSGEGSTPTLSVLYGSTSNTAVEGDTSITVTAGTNLTGGGSITLGSGGTVTLNVASSPTFSGTLTVQGTTATVGTTSVQGSLVLHDGAGETATIQAATPLGQSVTYTLPDPGQASADICLSTGNCTAVGTAGGDLTGNYPDPTIASLQGTTLTLSSVSSGDILQFNGTAWVNQSISGDITIDDSGVAAIQANSVALGTDTTGDYVATLGALTGLSTSGNSGEGSTPTLSVLYGNSANTAVQGNTTLTCPAGSGNLSGGGTVITLGNGGTCGDISITNSPTFTGTLTVSTIDTTSALTVGDVAQTFTLQGNATSVITANNGGNTTTVGFVTPTADATLNFPALSAGTYTICTSSGNCGGVGATLQTAYDNSSNPEIVLNGTNGALTVRDAASPIGANLLEVQNNDASTTYFAVNASGIQTTGSSVSSGNINTTGGVVQTNSVTRIDNSGNLTNIGTITNTGEVLHQLSADSAVAFQIQNASSFPVFNIDTTSANLITNHSIEAGTTGWSAIGSATISQLTTDSRDGTKSLRVAATGSNGGASYTYALSSSTEYTFSVWIKRAPSGSFSTIELGRSEDGSTNTSCATGQSANSDGWQRKTCTFTTGTVSGTTYVYVRQSDATTRDWYLDAIQLEASDTAAPYQNGLTDISGRLRVNAGTSADLSTVFIQGAGGGNALTVQGGGENALFQAILNVRRSDGTSLFSVGETGNGSVITGGSSFFDTGALQVIAMSSGVRALDVKGASGQSVDILRVKDSSNNTLLAVGAAGGLTVRTMTDSATAFQVSNASNAAVLTADTTSGHVTIGTSDTTGALLILDDKTDIGDPTGVNGAMYYNSAYGRFRCYQDGVWVDCIGSSPREYLSAKLGTPQTTNVSTGDHLKFDTVQASAGGSVNLDTSTTYTNGGGASIGRFTLAAGKSYVLRATIPRAAFSATTGLVSYIWYDTTAGTSIGTNGGILSSTHTGTDAEYNSYAEAFITPSVNTVVEVRFVNTSAISQLGEGSTFNPSAYIEVLDTGGSGGASAAEYLRAEMAAQQTTDLSNDNHIKFDTVNARSGSSITLDTTSSYTSSAGASLGRFTLKGGKTYRLNAHIPYIIFTSSSGAASWVWYDVTNDAELGSKGTSRPHSQTASSHDSPNVDAIFSPSADTLVEFRINAGGTTLQQIGNAGGFNPSAFIEVISDGTKIAQFQGATDSTDGQGGFVLAPTAGQQGSLLVGDGSWSSGLTFLNTTVDRGLRLESTDTAFIILNGDIDNDGSETGTAYIGFRQDGTGDPMGILGTVQQVDTGPDGNAATGALTNALYLGSGDELQFGTGDTVRMTILSDGLIGIGTNTPESYLHLSVNDNNATPGIKIENVSSGENAIASLRLVTDASDFEIRTGSSGSGIAGEFVIYDSTTDTLRLVIDDVGVRIGSGSNSDATLLILNRRSGSDPSGSNGGMYYNSSLGKFRCYENGAWVNCISAPPDVVIFTSSGTFTKADYPGLKGVRVRLVGGGGAGGGRSPSSPIGSGGGAGGYCEEFIPASSLGASVTVTVGAGGTGVSGGNGGNGGTSSFGTFNSASGGSGGSTGAGGSGSIDGGSGGGTSGCDLGIGGQRGEAGDANGSGAGGSSLLGMGGWGRQNGTTGSGEAPTSGYGGGGGGAFGGFNNQPGGNGRPGIVIVELYF